MKKWIDSLPLNQRLGFPLMLFILLVYLGFQIISYRSYIAIERDNLVNRTQILANGIAMNLTAPVLFNDSEAAREILTTFQADPLIKAVRLELPNGTLFSQYTRDLASQAFPSGLLIRLDKHDVVFSEHTLYLQIPVLLEKENIAHMHISVSLASLHAIQWTHLKISLLLFFGLVGVSTYIISRLQRWVIKPVSQLNAGIRDVIKGEAHQPITPVRSSRDELNELTESFNTMVDTISERDAALRLALRQLREEKSIADDIIETVQHGLVVVNQRGEITKANAACQTLFQSAFTHHDWPSLIDMLAPVEREAFQRLLDDALSHPRQIDHLIVEGAQPNGEIRTYQIVSRPLHSRLQTLFAIEDITAKHSAERQQKLAAKVFDNSQDAIILIDNQGRLTMVNSTFHQLTGYDQQNVMGMHFSQLVVADEYRQLQAIIGTALQDSGQWQGEINARGAKGEPLPLFVRITRISDTHKPGRQTVVVASDLRSMKEIQRLEYMANHDSLTNLANRVKLHRSLQALLEAPSHEEHGFAVLFMDLDNFKAVNDSHGHVIGDQVLRIVAERLRRAIRKGDLVSRLAGDEFVILLSPPLTEANVKATSQRLFERLSQVMKVGDKRITVGVSIGCYYVHPHSQESADDILRRADEAMYDAKLLGKGQMVEFNQPELDAETG